MAATLPDVELVVRVIAETAVANEKYFGDLDAVVGDGDFGYSMARGFEIVLSDWDGFDRSDISTFLKKIAVVITSRIGGTSGPIWGTAFLRAGDDGGGRGRAWTADAGRRDAARGRRGNQGPRRRRRSARRRCSTRWCPRPTPSRNRLKEGSSAGDTLRAAAVTARSAAEATRPMLAKRGRAAYTGERSIGSLDAGAVAVAVLLEALADAWT